VGALWLAPFVGGIDQALALGVAPFIPGDLLKIGAAALLLPAGWKLLGWIGYQGR
jgi:biotin transport system substrate-specific component